MKSLERIDTAVIGAGQAGLTISQQLTELGRSHLVLEASDRLGGGWLKRWDNFCLVTPNWSVRLPGLPYEGPEPDGYMLRDEVVAHLCRFAHSFDAPVRLATPVRRLSRDEGGRYRLETDKGTILADNVVVATGAYQEPKVPELANHLPARMEQLHTDEYQKAAALADGPVLVVGSGQSGTQIAEDLRREGRRVFLATSACGRVPRRYRGRDILEWLFKVMPDYARDHGFPPRTVADLDSPGDRFACIPHLSGRDGGHTINLRQLGRDGISLLGRLTDFAEGQLVFADNLQENLEAADAFEAKTLNEIDGFISRAGIDAGPPARPASIDFDPPEVSQLDLDDVSIATVIWATGYRLNFSWIDLPAFDADGYPMHDRGVSQFPGLYFLGLHWLYTMVSGSLAGVGMDAMHVAHHMAASKRVSAEPQPASAAH
jgi:putative flavoprotein involved in K+ transport